MHINDFDYELPQRLIAQTPAEKRDFSRLMVVHRDSGEVEHKHFYDILDYLKAGDCLVLNNSKVLPARLYGRKEGTGANIEFLLIKRIEGDTWETMVRPGKRLKPGDAVSFSDDKLFRAVVKDYGEDGTRIVEFEYEGIFLERLEELGKMPLPPYIDRDNNSEDKDRYQTVYAKNEGSVAAPTAGLHFTPELLEKAKAKGVKLAYVTLHVGIGTFRPVKVENIEEHHMHFEEYFIDEETAGIINDTMKAGGRIVSVGTTSTRTVESAAVYDEECGKYLVKAGQGSTGIFIYPGYEFKIICALITNFHLPKSTLLMLISALYNREDILRVYRIAVEEKYRFFSYGDAMFIE
jgi:S-adenosylmethionine:tRNA ribosyltransferase-isomerase